MGYTHIIPINSSVKMLIRFTYVWTNMI